MTVSGDLHIMVVERLVQTLPAKEAKYGVGKLIDLTHVAPIPVPKHRRPVAVMMAIEEFTV